MSGGKAKQYCSILYLLEALLISCKALSEFADYVEKQAAAYKVYKKADKSAYEIYKATDANAYDVYKQEDAMAYEAYKNAGK